MVNENQFKRKVGHVEIINQMKVCSPFCCKRRFNYENKYSSYDSTPFYKIEHALEYKQELDEKMTKLLLLDN